MNLDLPLKLAGLSFILLGILHCWFPRRFNWREEFARVSLLNRQIFYVHCFFIVLILLMFGVLCLCYTTLLLQPAPLARVVLSGLLLFWSCRLIFQLVVYDGELWRGNRFNTIAHIAFTCLWSYYVGVFALALWSQFQIK